MMLDIFLLLVGVAGFSLAGYHDLRTTEFSEWIPYGMIALAVGAKLVSAAATGGYGILTASLANGVVLLGLGLAMYFAGQWGDGEAWMLGVLGFMFPFSSPALNHAALLPMPVMLVTNMFLLGAAYMIVYALLLGIRHRIVFRRWLADVRSHAPRIAAGVVAFVAVLFIIEFQVSAYFGVLLRQGALLMPFAFALPVLLILLVWRYARVVETTLFRKRVAVSKLRVGDVVLASKLWKGLDKREVAALRRRGGTVVVKEGVRFAPVFLITFLVSAFLGDVMMLVF